MSPDSMATYWIVLQPTEDYGTPCNIVNSNEYINNCDYHGAYVVLQEIYGGLEVTS